MANLLHKIITGVHICLPSVIMHYIIRIITGSQLCAAPFGFLMTQLARSYGIVAPSSKRPEHTTIFNKTNILLMRLPPPRRVNPITEGDAKLEGAEGDATADIPQPHQPEPPQPPQQRSLEDRMTYVERDVSSIRTEFHEFREEVSGLKKFMKKSLKCLSNISSSCRRHDDAMSPSPTDSS